MDKEIKLREGEALIWQGKPEFWPFVMMGSWWMLPFSLALGGFFTLLQYKAIEESSIIGVLFVFPFFLFGLYLIIGRFWTWIRYWRNTCYVVTDRRIIIRAGALKPKTLSWDFSKISTVELKVKRPGLGHINFVRTRIYNLVHPFNAFIMLPTWTISKGLVAIAPSFRYVRNPEKVYQTIQSVRRE